MLMAEETVPMALGITDPPFTPKRWSAAEYDALVASGLLADLRLELLDGVIVEMTPIGDLLVVLTKRLTRQLSAALAQRAFVGVQNPIYCGEHRPQPDLAVFPVEDLDSPQTADRCLLVIEIADSSVRQDRAKAEIYARSKIPEYWLIDVNRRAIEVSTQPDPERGLYLNTRVFELTDQLTSAAAPELNGPVSQLFPAR
jgi:Uma2 family endonuclease